MLLSSTKRSIVWKKFWIFVFCWRDRNIGKNISKNLSSKCSQEIFDHAKKYARDALKIASQWEIQRNRSNRWFNWK